MIELGFWVVGFLVGLLVGRWPVLLLAVALGVWIAAVTEVDEVPHWFLGLAYALVAGAGLASGVWARRRSAKRREDRLGRD